RMSLEGSIKDFGLADILQLISMQKKSGVVTISHKNESTTLHFDNGQIVFATSINGGETMRLGELLVKAGKLEEQDVAKTLHIQEMSKERIGNLFVSSGLVSKEDVKEALQQQLMDVIFCVLRWKDGWYKFEAGDIDYDREYQIPLQTDFILMEGSRMVDEWSNIESKIPSDNIIFSQTDRGSEVELLFTRLSRDEVTVYNLIDGNRDIPDIIEISQLSRFHIYKILLTLMLSGLISQTSTSKKDIVSGIKEITYPEEIIVTKEHVKEKYEDNNRLIFAIQVAVLVFFASFILLLFPAGEMIGLSEIAGVSDFIKEQQTYDELYHLKRAIGYFYLVNGSLPDSIIRLSQEGYIGSDLTSDEWHNQFVYEKYPVVYPDNKASFDYRLFSKGNDNVPYTQDDIF
ncbi:MAG: DUF4388 domain-containing protein, partial [Nitrospirota bacterium]